MMLDYFPGLKYLHSPENSYPYFAAKTELYPLTDPLSELIKTVDKTVSNKSNRRRDGIQ